jgi:surface protein
MYGRNHSFETKEELSAAIEYRIEKKMVDDGTVNTWNVSAITDMSFLFKLSEFNEDISEWDTSNVTTMEGMFSQCAFNKPLFKNVSKVTNMKDMFKGWMAVTVFNQPLDWDVSSVVTMEGMFIDNKTFNQPLIWNTTSLVNCKNMFNRSIYNQPLSLDVSKVENMEGMFYLSPFNQDISRWNVGNVTNMKDMFRQCPFNQPLPWDVSKVENMEGMFYLSPFNQDISRWNVGNVTNMKDMFHYSKFYQNISGWNIERVSESTNMFSNNPMGDNNKPPAFKKVKRKITIFIFLHGDNLKDELPPDLPINTALAVRPGTCTFLFKKTSTEILEKIEAMESDYAGERIFAANNRYEEKYQPFEESYFEQNFEDAMKGTPGFTKEELFELHRNRTSASRSFTHNRRYSMLDDELSVNMGIFIINAQDLDGEIEINYPESIDIQGEFTPTRLPYVKEDYMLLQRRNLLNVEVASFLSPGGFQLESNSEYTNIEHVPSITLLDILLFFKKLGYDSVNIIDEACRVEKIHPLTRDEKSFKERATYLQLKDAYSDLGGTRKKRNTRYVKKIRSKRYRKRSRHVRNKIY